MNTNEHYKDAYTEAAYGDAVAILKNGAKMSIQEILDELNSRVPGICSEKPNGDIPSVIQAAFARSLECKLINISIPRTTRKDHVNDKPFISITLGYTTECDSFSFRDATSAGFSYDSIVQALTQALEDYQSGAGHE